MSKTSPSEEKKKADLICKPVHSQLEAGITGFIVTIHYVQVCLPDLIPVPLLIRAIVLPSESQFPSLKIARTKNKWSNKY